MAAPEIEKLVTLLARLPGLGPRSARRAALTLLRRREALMLPLADALAKAAAEVKSCTICGNLDARDPCGVCADERRDPTQLCVVEQVADLWAMERAGAFRGRYHVLGGTLSALDGIGPDELGIPKLAARVAEGGITATFGAVGVHGDVIEHGAQGVLRHVREGLRAPPARRLRDSLQAALADESRVARVDFQRRSRHFTVIGDRVGLFGER